MHPRKVTLTIEFVIASSNDGAALMAVETLAEVALWAITKTSSPEEWERAKHPTAGEPLHHSAAQIALAGNLTWEEFAEYGG